jgi:hypothetical protein
MYMNVHAAVNYSLQLDRDFKGGVECSKQNSLLKKQQECLSC